MQAKFHGMLKISKNDQEIALYRLKKDTIIIGKENLSRLSHVVLNKMFIDNYN